MIGIRLFSFAFPASSKRTINHVLTLLLFSLLSAPAFAKSSIHNPLCAFDRVHEHSPKIHVGYFSFPPYAIKQDDGSFSGIWVDYLKELLGRTGIEYTEAVYPAKRLASEMFAGTVHLSIITNNLLEAAGEERLSYLKQPIMQLRSGIASLKQAPVYSLESQRNGVLGVNRGYSYGGLIYQAMAPEMNITLWPTDSELQIMRLLLGRRVQAALIYESILTKGAEHWGLETSKLHFEPLYTTDFYIALNKSITNLEGIKTALSNNVNHIDLNSMKTNCVRPTQRAENF